MGAFFLVGNLSNGMLVNFMLARNEGQKLLLFFDDDTVLGELESV